MRNLVVSILGLAPVLLAQPSPRPVALDSPPTAFAGVFLDDLDANGVLWSRGASWKASFAADGVVYYPLFGAHAPRHFPIELRYRGARFGTHVVPRSATKLVRASDRRVVLDHGGLVERWDLAPHAIEQTFDVPVRLGGGDLVVELQFATELQRAESTADLVFSAPGLGTVSYGETVVVDANDQHLPASLELAGGTLCLRVADAILDRAAFPIALDPLLLTRPINTTANDSTLPEVSYDATNDVWLVVYTDAAAVNDTDIRASRFAGDGTFLDSVFVNASTEFSGHPGVANNDAKNEFFVVWLDQNAFTTAVRGRTRVAASTTQGSALVLATPRQAYRPRVGGSSNPLVGDYAVVFGVTALFVNDQIQCAIVDPFTGRTSVHTVDAYATCVDNSATLSADCDALGNWIVVWASRPACLNGDIRFAVVSPAGLQGPSALVDGAFGLDFGATVSGTGNRFVVTWERRTGGQRDIMGAVLERTGGNYAKVGSTINLTALEPGANLAADQQNPEVACDGCRFAYAYLEGGIPHAATFALDASRQVIFHEGHVRLTAGTNPVVRLALASRGESKGGTDRYFVALEEALGGGTTHDVVGALYAGHSSSGGITTVSTHCPSRLPPVLASSSVPALGLPLTVTLTASGTPAILVGLPATVPLPLCTTATVPCKLGLTSILLSVIGSSLTLTVPCDPFLVGGMLAFQGVSLGTSGGCTAAQFGVAFAVTDTLIATFQ